MEEVQKEAKLFKVALPQWFVYSLIYQKREATVIHYLRLLVHF